MDKTEIMSKEAIDALLAMIEKHEAELAAARPDDIPETVWGDAVRLFGISQGRTVPATIAIAQALLAERQRAVQICKSLGVHGGADKNSYADWKTHADNLALAIAGSDDRP